MIDRSKLHLIHGGHKGAEAEFGRAAVKWDIAETTISFSGHRMDFAKNVEELDDDALEKGHVSMEFVFQRMGRRFARGEGHRRVIYSMFHIVTRSDVLFAIGWIHEDGTVKGGTGWGVELAKVFNKRVHVFDQERNAWFSWDGSAFKPAEPVLPDHGTFSATGTRNLSEAGREAIGDLFQRSLG
jgi:hypothetical protein